MLARTLFARGSFARRLADKKIPEHARETDDEVSRNVMLGETSMGAYYSGRYCPNNIIPCRYPDGRDNWTTVFRKPRLVHVHDQHRS